MVNYHDTYVIVTMSQSAPLGLDVPSPVPFSGWVLPLWCHFLPQGLPDDHKANIAH